MPLTAFTAPQIQAAHFQYIQESDDRFLALFPHRYDYIWAEHPAPGNRPQWQTENRHPLSDRLVQQGAYLYGVRHGATTEYVMLDVDRGSQYHPTRDRYAIARIKAALEELGLVEGIPITSSYSGGIHLYFPFSGALPTWDLAIAVEAILANAGFKVAPGQLEIFPNAKSFSNEGFSLYAAHRLPLQSGSYILTDNWEPTRSDQAAFVTRWHHAQDRNDLDGKKLKQIAKQSARRQHRISGSANKFLNDLMAEVFKGWSSRGQTNRLLGRIAMLLFIFGHVLHGGPPLQGKDLAAAIASTARTLPGFEEFCGHQHELDQRAQEWANCIENSRYFPYGGDGLQADTEPDDNEWNRQQREEARRRITQALQTLSVQGALPEGATARFNLLKQQGIGSDTLYNHKDLWHPQHLKVPLEALFPPSPSISLGGNVGGSLEPPDSPTEVLGGSGGESTVVSVGSPSFVTKIIEGIRKRSRQAQLSLFPLEQPPDENFFRYYREEKPE